MNTKTLTTAALLTVTLTASSAFAAIFENDFSDASQASNYATDRTNPGGFTVNDSGDGDLSITVRAADEDGFTGGFFNWHGISTQPVGDLSAPPGTTVTVDVYVPADWDGATARRGGDL